MVEKPLNGHTAQIFKKWRMRYKRGLHISPQSYQFHRNKRFALASLCKVFSSVLAVALKARFFDRCERIRVKSS